MDALEVLKNRRSIRKFKSEQIKKEELEAVLEAGTYAPTGKNVQDPVIVAVQDKDILKRVKVLNAKIMGNTDSDPYYGAPTVILVLVDPDLMYDKELSMMDGAAVETNMLNAAYAVGLGSCWINRPQKMFDTEEGKQLLIDMGLKESLFGVASIALGYADCENPIASPRKKDYIHII